MGKDIFLIRLYDKKALLLILFIAIISTLPWIGLGEFYTKGEPREAALAISMIDKGEWIIPSSYADEFAYKPPLNHWIISAFSIVLNGGEVTPFTSRLPSTIAFVAIVGICFVFFSRRLTKLQAFVSCLVFITCFEIHRAAMTTRIDMLLTFLLIAGMIQLLVWYEKGKTRQLIGVWILLTFATLVKGPVGVLLPCLVFGAYLLIQKENIFKIILKCIIVGLPALIVPLIWYYAAYQIRGEEFLVKVFAENFGRFLRIETDTLGIDYNLGVEEPWFYYPLSLLAGLLPWTILLITSLFFIRYTGIKNKVKSLFSRKTIVHILDRDKTLLYSLTIILITLFFFTIPASKRSTYIMLIYPFLGIFIARLFIYLSEYKYKSVKISTNILVAIGTIILVIVGLAFFGVINVENLLHGFVKRERTLNDIRIFSNLFKNPGYLGLFASIILIMAIVVNIIILKSKIGLKILMAGFGMMLAINIYMDAFLIPAFKDAYSTRPFAEVLEKKYDLKDNNVYVTNNLLKYINLYGLNFYLHNNFKNFEKELPKEGYFLAAEGVGKAVEKEYDSQYEFTKLEVSSKQNDTKQPIIFYSIKKKN